MTTWNNTTFNSNSWTETSSNFYVYSGYWVAGYAEYDANYWAETSYNSDSWTNQTAGANTWTPTTYNTNTWTK